MVYLIGIIWLFTAIVLWYIARVYFRARRPGIAVLLYHRLKKMSEWETTTGAERNFCCPTERFEAHIAWMQDNGFGFITLDEVHRITTNNLKTNRRLAAITFDDGSESVFRYAAPFLAAQQIPATVFVTVDQESWVHEHERRMSDEQLRTISQRGFTIGAHGMSHHGLNELPPTVRDAELIDAREYLKTITGENVRDLALPLNFYNQDVLDSAKAHGYRMVFTSNPGLITDTSNVFELPRITVEGQFTTNEVSRILSPRWLAGRQILAGLKRLPPRLLGEARWMPIRQRLFDSPLGRYLHARPLLITLTVLAILWIAGLTSSLFWCLSNYS